jgi:hypothetical protein
LKSTATILQRSIAAPFYRRNAGFFLFIFFLLFGMQPNLKQTLEFHLLLINGIATTLNFFIITAAIWVLYAFRTIHFFNGCLKNKAYNFLQTLNTIEAGKRFLQLLLLSVQLLLPVICYGMLAVILAVKNNHIPGAAAIFFTLLLITFLTSIIFYSLLQKNKREKIRLPLPSLRLPDTLFSFLLKFIFNEQFILLLLLKIITFSCLYFFAKTDPTIFEDRMLWMIYLTALIGHCILIYRNQHFMELKMSFFRNMPVKPVSTLFSLLGVYLVVLIPEIWALKGVAIQQHDIINYVWMILTGPALLLLLHCLLYTEDMKMEGFLQLLFGVWIVTIFFSLSSNRWMLPLICLGMAIFIFFNSYYAYEKKAEIESLE